jgi:hypothetical protein
MIEHQNAGLPKASNGTVPVDERVNVFQLEVKGVAVEILNTALKFFEEKFL